jgi:hypothetical protein
MAAGRGCCWIATMGSNHMIFGIGKNEQEAIQNALKRIGGNRYTPVMFECMLCTAVLYKAVKQYGAAGISWELDEYGVAGLVGDNA